APSDPDIIYVGTGSDGMRSNVITGKGVYKSTDAGKKWSFVGLEKTGQIGAVEIHPNDPNTVFVAAIGQAFGPNSERGVYRTKDGGESWEQVLFIADTIGISDVEFSPDNPDIIYAGAWRGERKPWTIISGGMEGGIYKSTDGGDSWRKLENGLPTGLIGKVDLAVSMDDPERLWALIEAPQGTGGVYRSDDRGESFRLVSTKKELLDRPFYYANIDANPLDADIIFVSATRFWKSVDGGMHWQRKSTPHGDNHDLWINPLDTLIMVQANDGGVNVTTDGGKSWSTQRNQPTAELYQVEVDDQFPYWLYAGQQDNSTIAVPNLPPYAPVAGGETFWMAVGGCETGPVVPKPGNPDIVYANCKGRFGTYHKKTGQEQQYYVGATYIYGHNPADLEFRFQRVAPIHVSPHDPDVVYHASQYLHRTTDDGRSWEIISPDLTAFEPDKQVISGSPITRDITGEEYYSTIYSVRESPLEKGLIWVGANDGPVHITRDGGENWKDITPAGLLPGGRVDCVEPSPHRPEKAYIAVLRYQLDDWAPYVYRTEDYGQSWQLITEGIPADYPVRVVREDPDREGLLYAGTEFGVFVSFDDGEHWQLFQQNLPITPITDIKVHRKDLVLSTMGRGFWVIDDLSPLHQLQPDAVAGGMQLFKPRDTYRMRYRSWGSGAVPDYPEAGAYVHYYLPEKAEPGLQLEVYDGENNLIRAFTSESLKPDSENEGPDMATGFVPPRPSPGLRNKAGMHRFVWDLRHTGPWHENARRSGRGGPMVVPGSYRLVLRSGEKVSEQYVEVVIDPRLSEANIDKADLLAQEKLLLEVRDRISAARQMAETVEAYLKRVDEKKMEISAEQREEVLYLSSELVTAEGRYRKPMLIDQLEYLYNMLNRADQPPGQDAYERTDELTEKLADLKKRWDALDKAVTGEGDSGK
ncbi:MAG: hypothetical protein R3350_01375, partial [Saprospiraceae bacterium]|nr:hypothetical protein [Saprospiraceae bacterium]